MRLDYAYWYLPFGTLDSTYTAFRRVSEEPMLTYSFKELDRELEQDQYYFGARYYNPAIGRFGSPDPIKSYTNPYSYVYNNPIMYIDPTGMAAIPASGGLTAQAISGGFLPTWWNDPMAWASMLAGVGENVYTQWQAWMLGYGMLPAGANKSAIISESLDDWDPSVVAKVKQEADEALASGAIDREIYDLLMEFLDAGKIIRHPQMASSEYSVAWVGPGWDWSTEGICLSAEHAGYLQNDQEFELGFAVLIHEIGHAWSRRQCDPGEFFNRYLTEVEPGSFVFRDPWGYAMGAKYLSTIDQHKIDNRFLRTTVRKWKSDPGHLSRLIEYLQRKLSDDSW